MGKVYVIRYCKPDGNGGLERTTPDRATVFQVFTAGFENEHIGDFFPLSRANEWIKAHSKD